MIWGGKKPYFGKHPYNWIYVYKIISALIIHDCPRSYIDVNIQYGKLDCIISRHHKDGLRRDLCSRSRKVDISVMFLSFGASMGQLSLSHGWLDPRCHGPTWRCSDQGDASKKRPHIFSLAHVAASRWWII